jgi:hypothetical protein
MTTLPLAWLTTGPDEIQKDPEPTQYKQAVSDDIELPHKNDAAPMPIVSRYLLSLAVRSVSAQPLKNG